MALAYRVCESLRQRRERQRSESGGRNARDLLSRACILEHARPTPTKKQIGQSLALLGSVHSEVASVTLVMAVQFPQVEKPKRPRAPTLGRTPSVRLAAGIGSNLQLSGGLQTANERVRKSANTARTSAHATSRRAPGPIDPRLRIYWQDIQKKVTHAG
jgi:hypothetical protein